MTKKVELLSTQDIFTSPALQIEEAKLRHEKTDGSMSEVLTRLVMDRGDSVAVLLHDVEADRVLLAEQFRYSTYKKGPGWLLEIPAGVLDEGEDPETCARREAMEETGYRVGALERIASVYPSPGGCSERIDIFYAAVNPEDRQGQGGGLAQEGEDIQARWFAVSEALGMLDRRELQDAKTCIALLWLRSNRSHA